MTTQLTKPEETLALIAERAKVSSDSFTVKVNRKQGMGSLYQTVAVLGGAGIAHLGQPEAWLAPLCGGGDFQLAIFHVDEPATRVGGFLFCNIKAPPSEVRSDVVAMPGWHGPSEIIFPKGGSQAAAPAQGQVQTSGVTLTPGNLPPGSGPTQGHWPVQWGAPVGPALPQNFFDEQRRLDEARREEERKREEAHQRRLAELRAQEDELKRKAEAQAIRAEAAEREVKLRAELAERDARSREESLKASNSQGTMKELVLGLAPLLMQMMQSSREQQARMMEEMRRSQEQAQARTDALLERLTSGNNGPRPEMTAMLEMMKASSSANAEMMGRMVEATGMVAQMSTGMIETIAELNLGSQPQGHPMLEAVKEGVRALSTLQSGANASARKMVQQAAKSPALPAPQPPSDTAATATHKPTNGQHPASVQAPASAPVPAPNMPQAFDGLPPKNSVDKLEEMIRAHHEPVEDVAKFFFASLETPEMKQALNSVGGDPFALIGERLGAVWTMDDANVAYLRKLGAVVDEMGVRLGVFEDSGEEATT